VKKQQTPSLHFRVGHAIDQAVGLVAPRWAWKRARLRLVNEAAFQFAKYQGAERGRLFGHWLPGGGSADADLLPDLALLRERSRDLNRNDAIAAGITGTKVANVIGTGIRPQSRLDRNVLGLGERQADALQKSIEAAWQAWVPWADAKNRQAQVPPRCRTEHTMGQPTGAARDTAPDFACHRTTTLSTFLTSMSGTALPWRSDTIGSVEDLGVFFGSLQGANLPAIPLW